MSQNWEYEHPQQTENRRIHKTCENWHIASCSFQREDSKQFLSQSHLHVLQRVIQKVPRNSKESENTKQIKLSSDLTVYSNYSNGSHLELSWQQTIGDHHGKTVHMEFSNLQAYFLIFFYKTMLVLVPEMVTLTQKVENMLEYWKLQDSENNKLT